MSVPTVVSAMQSPTLLNILAKSEKWRLRVCDMGDAGGLAELQELRVSAMDARPDVVLVCSPNHYLFAKRHWPQAKVVWVVHNGRFRWLLPDQHPVDAVVCFSERVQWLVQAGRNTPVCFLSPAYEAKPVWSWKENCFWTLRNRPESRADDIDSVIAAVTQGLSHQYYGQGQKNGYASAATRTGLLVSCSGYVNALDRCAGFGLAAHEALAAGVPVVSGFWGDMCEELDSYRGFTDDLQYMATIAKTLSTSKDFAQETSEQGLGYIRRYRTQARMDQTIMELLQKVV